MKIENLGYATPLLTVRHSVTFHAAANTMLCSLSYLPKTIEKPDEDNLENCIPPVYSLKYTEFESYAEIFTQLLQDDEMRSKIFIWPFPLENVTSIVYYPMNTFRFTIRAEQEPDLNMRSLVVIQNPASSNYSVHKLHKETRLYPVPHKHLECIESLNRYSLACEIIDTNLYSEPLADGSYKFIYKARILGYYKEPVSNYVQAVPYTRGRSAIAYMKRCYSNPKFPTLDTLNELITTNRVEKTSSIIPSNYLCFDKMNEAQQQAFSCVFRQNLTLIQGPPGTGKTTISAYLAHANVSFNNGKVLISSHSNQAVDNICIRLIDEFSHLKIVRVLSRFEMDLLPEFDVVCATCITSGDVRFSRLKFNLVIVDEATQCIEPFTLIPFSIGSSCQAQHFVLVGDQCQLGPIVQLQHSPLSISLFERLVHSQFPISMLTVIFYHHTWFECREFKSTSYYNEFEAVTLIKLLKNLLGHGVSQKSVGIVTPYVAQKAYLQNLLNASKLKVELDSIDGYQGREKDYIIFSCVRSNMSGCIGFLKEPRRLNVALTRARRGLILLGNANTLALSQDKAWACLLYHYKKMELIHALEPTHVFDHKILPDASNLKTFEPLELIPEELRGEIFPQDS
ncbi:hypothetical protein Ciccas_011776 [Cichlidogyrus casuarinus]|uniref:Helicase ATP-binding domain-containing protein n=1 Tax=Cichlidogyrus casuarinus TaxID=1844966 RepID=A0ABD2PQA4_9PLAT